MDNQRRFKAVRVLIFLGLLALGFYFWSRYQDKVPQVPVETVSWEKHEGGHFSIRTPTTYVADEAHLYQGFGPGKDISGVAFTIPSSYAKGTNLSPDSYISVEQRQATACLAAEFLPVPQNQKMLTENDISYAYADSIEPAAGNIYEEHVYALTDSEPCTAVRYFIHSGNIYNYEPGAVQEFDKAKLLAEFDAIRGTLLLNK